VAGTFTICWRVKCSVVTWTGPLCNGNHPNGSQVMYKVQSMVMASCTLSYPPVVVRGSASIVYVLLEVRITDI